MKSIEWDLDQLVRDEIERKARRAPRFWCVPVGGPLRVTCGAVDVHLHIDARRSILVASKNRWAIALNDMPRAYMWSLPVEFA